MNLLPERISSQAALRGEPSPRLQRAFASLPLLRMPFAHRMQGDLRLEPFKGGLWHGVFGASLHDISVEAFECLMEQADDARRPWALHPPEMTDEWVPAGGVMRGSLLLAGTPAIAHAAACAQALQRMGERGFGSERVRATLVELGARHADGTEATLAAVVSAPPTALDVWRIAACGARDTAPAGLRLRLATPLRIKHEGELLRAVPPLDILMRRLLARLVLLLPQQPGGLFEPGERDELLYLALAAPLVAHQLMGVEWTRYSARQKRTMPFEGLLGTLEYGPPAGVLLPWFALAEWLQLGAKTTFGFGVVEARGVPADTD